MFAKNQQKSTDKEARKNTFEETAKTVESLIITFVLVLTFITFVMQTFIIPTGSMANTLKGAYFKLACPQCGYKYDYGYRSRNPHQSYGFGGSGIPGGTMNLPFTRCPNCSFDQATEQVPIVKGDRIFVMKCIYQFFEPKRWDVVVFKYPGNPKEAYIKRLIGLPGETVEIIDGDIYIDGKISSKSPKAQETMWSVVYDNDYQPVKPIEGSFNGSFWRQPFDFSKSQWQINKDAPAEFILDNPPDKISNLAFKSDSGYDFRAVCAYNDIQTYNSLPYCSDLMMRFYIAPTDSKGIAGMSLSKYETNYKAWVDLSGEMVISKVFHDKETVLSRKSITLPEIIEPILVTFTNVDHKLSLRFGSEELNYDLGALPDAAGPRKTFIAPQVNIFGSGRLAVSHIAVFKDFHYTEPKGILRAGEGNPLKLNKDEFFMLGDNTADSLDGRLWNRDGQGNNGKTYRQGVVPREYLVGKAWIVVLPGFYKPFKNFPYSIVPDTGRLRFIYGGSSKTPAGNP